MPLEQLDNLVRSGQLKAEPPAQAEVDVDEQLLAALIRVAHEVSKRLAAVGPLPNNP